LFIVALPAVFDDEGEDDDDEGEVPPLAG